MQYYYQIDYTSPQMDGNPNTALMPYRTPFISIAKDLFITQMRLEHKMEVTVIDIKGVE